MAHVTRQVLADEADASDIAHFRSFKWLLASTYLAEVDAKLAHQEPAAGATKRFAPKSSAVVAKKKKTSSDAAMKAALAEFE